MGKLNKITIVNVALFFLSILVLVFGIYFWSNQKEYPNLQILDWRNESTVVHPLLAEYHWINGKERTLHKSQKQIDEFLQDSNNDVHVNSIGLTRLDFWETAVVQVKATIDGKEVQVRRTDGNYYIDFGESDSIKVLEVTSYTSFTSAKYVFRLVFTKDKVSEISYNKAKKLILDCYHISDEMVIYLCGFDEFIPFNDATGYVLKVCKKGYDISNKVFGVDPITMKVYQRDGRGQYTKFD